MNTAGSFDISAIRYLNRNEYVKMLQVAHQCKSYRFMRQACLHWLAIYPGDLEVQYLQAVGIWNEGKPEQASVVLERVCRLDPEYLQAQQALASIAEQSHSTKELFSQAAVYALGGAGDSSKVPVWSRVVRHILDQGLKGDPGQSLQAVMSQLADAKDVDLLAVEHMKLTAQAEDIHVSHALAQIYHQRWPDSLAFRLYLADAEMQLGDESNAVNLLHYCASFDPAGQVPNRLWGNNFPYKSLWPEELKIYFDIQVPADVSAIMGWNQLSNGGAHVSEAGPNAEVSPVDTPENENAHIHASRIDAPVEPIQNRQPTKTSGPEFPFPVKTAAPSEKLVGVEQELEGVARRVKKPGLGRADSRFPIYVVLSSRQGLQAQYGSHSSQVIIDELNRLVETIRSRKGWGAITLYPDDMESMGRYGLTAVDTADPWKIKLALADLDNALEAHGQMIGCVLIVGGQQVIPFHRLPNPTDDMDESVLSDNPYTTLDGNYFIPNWPVGRLPGEAGTDAGLLLEEIRQINSYHCGSTGKSNLFQQIKETLALFFRDPFAMFRGAEKPFNYGLTAAVWRSSSVAAFQPIGDTRSLQVSPPISSSILEKHKVSASTFGYYNLHGLSDSPEWYGQKDAGDTSSAPDYPVAVSSLDIVKDVTSPSVVFSEACYGGYVVNKAESQSVALRFIAVGVNTLVASTCVSYGSITTPLIGADLLGNSFWTHVQEGFTAGDAFMQAKIDLAREMTRRQGYLDGEDQKTLISFVLFGDPLMGSSNWGSKMKGVQRITAQTNIRTSEEGLGDDEQLHRASGEMIAQVKSVLEPFLPGLESATIHVNRSSVKFNNRKKADGSPTTVTNLKVSVCKEVHLGKHANSQYAHVTLNKEGKVIKMAVSR
ncbi:MAG TPA: hypothetical protein VN376_04155 [Longilinea sp.]|nr:hypothetical protein [Longilinea sp.]